MGEKELPREGGLLLGCGNQPQGCKSPTHKRLLYKNGERELWESSEIGGSILAVGTSPRGKKTFGIETHTGTTRICTKVRG